MTFLDLFAGVGGFRIGMEKAGHRCVGFCEIDKFAIQSYKAIHDTKKEVEMNDITKVTDEEIRRIGSVDVICGGFPCQAFSVAGRRKGFSDTRGTLFFEIARFASILKPEYIFLENVKGLLNHEGGDTFETILRSLDDVGYDCEWEVLNSKAYVPQNRERLYIIGRLRGSGAGEIFPITKESRSADISGLINLGNVNPSGRGMSGKVYCSKGISPTLTTSEVRIAVYGKRKPGDILVKGSFPGKYRQSSVVFSPEGICPTLTTMQGGNQEPKILIKEGTKKGYSEAKIGDSINLSYPNSKTRRGRVGKQVAQTILTGSQQGTVTPSVRIRKLTPLECWRLQAFPDWAFLAAKFGSKEIAEEILTAGLDHYDCEYQQVMSDSQLYKQAGNSVTTSVIYEIARKMVINEI
ncbi:DNA cytosine methyltransferase [uncultured Enterococcus sp.]|uniref:DNA cytosine methyltransferase n=1 Tax=uncultured Enterococcus sp. TaxID=167972 RepID=UPI002AA8196C|nr:DNA cytosine methyltransferase [uncultured Enterococcus sp.]